jgi:hypothetical protein
VARARAVLEEQERQIILDLSNAFAEVDRAHGAVEASRKELGAAVEDQQATKAAYDADQIPVDLLLESQQRLAESQRQYFRTLTDYAIALKNVHVQKGTLLPYNGVLLQEGPWPAKAYRDAYDVARRWPPKRLSFARTVPAPISAGGFAAGMVAPEVDLEAVPSEADSDNAEAEEPLPTPPEAGNE